MDNNMQCGNSNMCTCKPGYNHLTETSCVEIKGMLTSLNKAKSTVIGVLEFQSFWNPPIT